MGDPLRYNDGAGDLRVSQEIFYTETAKGTRARPTPDYSHDADFLARDHKNVTARYQENLSSG